MAGVTLNRDSAASIHAKLGTTDEREVGAGHDVLLSWCYLVRRDTSSALLELMSDASDMGTAGHALNVIRLRASSLSEERSGCAPLATNGMPSTPAGLRLGLTTRAIRRMLGSPSRQAADSIIYEFVTKEYMRPGSPGYRAWNTPTHRKECFEGGRPYSNVFATVIILLSNGHASEVRLERYDQATC